MTDSNAFENRATLRPEENQEVLCMNCDEPFVFGLKDKSHEFSIGLTTILECLVVAEHEGYVPPFSDEWWRALARRYQSLGEIRDNLSRKRE